MKQVFDMAIVMALVIATATAITVFNYPASSPAVAQQQQQIPEPKTNPAQLVQTPEQEPIVVEIISNSTDRLYLNLIHQAFLTSTKETLLLG
ncbi:MAG: hypothetical protein M3299_00035 [Thermoproteota archaeon]|nr:hypothetical protein [Thermoproteota archaeon]